MERVPRHTCEVSYGSVPSVIYQEEQGGAHGNFLPASYRAICAHPEWRKRLAKSYSGGKWVPRSWERKRFELDCANSSDALLMNIFCYPRVLRRPGLCSLLGIEPGLLPFFGFRPRTPLSNGRLDRTEIDMRIGSIFVEAKLTETGFQSAPSRLLLRYAALEEVFDIAELPIAGDSIQSYQLIRGVLAASEHQHSYLLLCDARRADHVEGWFKILWSVRSYSFRNRLKLLTWQELARTLPGTLKQFLEQKYGIVPA